MPSSDTEKRMNTQMEKLQQLNNIIRETHQPDQETTAEWMNTIKMLYQTMQQTLIDAGKTYLVKQLHKCWICTQHGKVESENTAGMIFCNNKKCRYYFYYWSMCQTLYGDVPRKIFNQIKEEMGKENTIYA